MTLLDRAVRSVCYPARIPIVVGTLLVVVGIGLWLPRVDIDPYSLFDPGAIDAIEPEGIPIRSAFPAFDMLTVSVLAEESDAFSPEVLTRVATLAERLDALPEISAVQSVTSTTLVESVDNVLVDRPLLARTDSPEHAARLKAELEADPLLERFFLAPDGSAWNVLVVPSAESDVVTAARAVAGALDGDSDAIIGGYPHYLERAVDYITGDTRRIGVAVALMTLFTEIFLLRHLGRAVIVWLTAGAAAMALMGAYTAFEIVFGVEQLLIVVLVVIVSTSYGIHVVRYQDSDGTTPCEAAANVSRIVFLAATTTMLGFATLFASAVPQLVDAAVFALLGVAVAMGFALFPGAAALSLVHNHPGPMHHTPRGFGDEPHARKGRRAATAVTVALIAVALSGVPRILVTPAGPQHLFRPRTDAYRSIQDVQRHYGSTSELLLYIDSGSEFGLLNPEWFGELERISREFDDSPQTGGVVGYTDIVAWFWQRYGTPDELQRTPEAIGEALELMAGRDDVLGISAFVDPSYRYTRLLVRIDDFSVRTDVTGLARDFTRRLNEAGQRYSPDFAVYAGGISYEHTVYLQEVIRSIGRGVLAFFPVLFVLMVLVIRNARKALVLVLPSLVGVAVYLGIFGWIGVPFSTISAIGLAAVMGVAVDDAVYVGLFREHAVGKTLSPAVRAVIETTIVIVSGFSVLAFSRIGPVAPMVAAAAVALSCATATVVLVVPHLLHVVEQ